MIHNKVEKDGIRYIEGVIGETFISSQQDALDFIVQCGEYETNRILLSEENLTEDFFDLKTRCAGNILQKFTNYSIKAAIVISEKRINGRFGELVGETRNSRSIHFFTDGNDAIAWLIRSK